MEKALRNLLKFHLILLAFLTTNALGATTCPLEELKDISADTPECYFYIGTAAYRAKDFEKAATYWKELIGLNLVPIEVEHLKVEAYNNLGYLYFFGKGVPINKMAAIEYWTYAMKSGNEESAYHLCHAYADKKEPMYNPKVALGYCKEGIRRYALLKEWDIQIKEIVGELQKYVRNLEK
jgi:hypothetical protein